MDAGGECWVVGGLGVDVASMSSAMGSLLIDVRVIGIGEGAHFVREFNGVRASVVQALVESHGVTHLALEVGPDEAPMIAAWLDGHGNDSDLIDVLGPLTAALYGSFLIELRRRLGGVAGNLGVLGVDLPNSLTLEPTLAPLAEVLTLVDPDALAVVADVRRRSAAIVGGSAAASSTSWTALDPPERLAITVELSRLAARATALFPLYASRATTAQARLAGRLADAAMTTVFMLQAMAELFDGTGREADTSMRERFIADQLLDAVADLPRGARIAYLAHNNHIQKTPVMFGSYLAAIPAGLYLHEALGNGYVAVAQTHLDTAVPEMDVPADNAVGFRITRTPLETPQPGSVEAIAAGRDVGDLVLIRPATDGVPTVESIRSQSAVTACHLPATFDAALISVEATDDTIAQQIITDHGG
jgi:erythromycin esterase